MRDVLIDELFGPGGAPLQEQDLQANRGPAYFNADYNVEHHAQYYRMPCYPSAFANENLLYVQLLGSELFSAAHYTRRTGLASWLIAQTFAGKGMLEYEGTSYTLEPGDVFWIDCRRPHAYEAVSPQGWGYRMLHLDGAALAGLYAPVLQRGCVKFTPQPDSVFQTALRELFAKAAHQDEAFELTAHRILTELVCDLLAQLPQYSRRTLPPVVRRQQDWLRENCTAPLTLEAVAEQFHLSKYHLEREFRRHTGQTVFAYLAACRIERAKRLLRTTDLPVAEIGTQVGFAEYTGFYRTFCRCEKQSPAQYRKHWREL